MTDDQDQQRDHWRELADLLGLEPERPGGAAKAAPPQEAVARVQPEAKFKPEVLAKTAFEERSERRPARPPAMAPEPPVKSAAALIDDFEADAESRAESPPSMKDGDAEAEAARERETAAVEREGRDWEARADEERPQRGQRRRGRRGRPEAESDSAPAVAEGGARPEGPELSEEIEEPGDADPRGRRGNRRSPEALEEEPVQEEPLEEAETASAADDDIDEEDNLSDWSVPSWTELIASLYRPER
jgi:hypothetical protein